MYGAAAVGQGEMEQKELHAITSSSNRREMEQKMCSPNILGSCITFYQAPNLSGPFLPFPLVSLPISLSLSIFPSLSCLSVSSHRSSHGQEPHSQWVQRVPFQSLAVVIFQLARCSPLLPVCNEWLARPLLYTCCSSQRLRAPYQAGASPSLHLTLSFDTL